MDEHDTKFILDNKKLLYCLDRISLSLEKINNNLEKIVNVNNEKKESLEIDSLNIKNILNENITNKEIKDIFSNYKGIKKNLENKNIKIKKVDEVIDEFDNIACFMGNKYNLIKSIYILMKRDLNTKIGVKIDLKNKTQEEISAITNLCTKLYNIAFLEDYSYTKPFLYFRTGQIPLGVNFITGIWFERYVYLTIKEMFTSNNIIRDKYEILTNVHVILPDNNITELDILVYYNNKCFWIEVKTGSYQKFVEKYSQLTTKLKFNESFFIHVDIDMETANQLSKIMNMNVIDIQNLKKDLKNKILF